MAANVCMVKASEVKAWTRHDKIRQGKSRLDKAWPGNALSRLGQAKRGRQAKTRQGKASQDKARQGKTRLGKARQGRQAKTRQGMA